MTDRQFRILVVDDEDIVVSLVRDALEDEGLQVECASSGQQALDLMIQFPFDLLITDIRMPGMDGIQLVERVREMFPQIGVIFMTGYANLNSAKDAIKQGAYDYIMKPFELMEIRQAVHKAIDIHEEAAEKNPAQALNHLSDLNQMLFTADDRRSLIISSMRFSMMHQKADHASIIFAEPSDQCHTLVSITNDQLTERTLPWEPVDNLLKRIQQNKFDRPLLIANTCDIPFEADCSDEEITQCFSPDWMGERTSAIAIPIHRNNSILAILLLGFTDDTVKVREADLTFLAIAASQAAMSIENLGLLEETRSAYAKLQELQDKTISLEKMAARGQLSAEVGHELNNFLGVVAGNLSMLEFHLSKGKVTELEKYVTTMSETLEKMKRFTGNLMDLRSISSAKEIIHFDRMIREVVEYLRPQKRFEEVTLTVEHLDPDIPFEADATQIQQLLYNLFNNAADATIDCPDRSIAIRVRKHHDKDTFDFSIRDNGVGFPAEVIEKAFQEKFTTKESGHGFGLVVCRRIIDNHGGQVKIDSAPGQGSTINIQLPLAMTPELARV